MKGLSDTKDAIATLVAGEEVSIPQKLQLYGLDQFFDEVLTVEGEYEELRTDELVEVLNDDLRIQYQGYVEDGDTIDTSTVTTILGRVFKVAAITRNIGMPNAVESTVDERRLGGSSS